MPTDTKTIADELLKEVLDSAEKKKKEAEKEPEEDLDLDKLKQRTPPSRGDCRRCGENKPINRMMLCYPCWVKTNLEEQGWREGMPHPEWCRCEGIGGHSERKSFGN